MLSKNEGTAELMGLSFGDGGLTERKGTNRLRFQLRGDIVEDREHYDRYIIPLFNKQVMNPLFNRNVGIVYNQNKGFYGISVESKKLISLHKLGIPIGPKKELLVPCWIEKSQKFTKCFLRGFLDTDGSIHCQRNYSVKNNKLHNQIRLTLGCCSKVLMFSIYKKLKNLGFKCILKKEVKKDRDNYVVKLSGAKQVNKWLKTIGSKNPKHITKYLVWKKFGFCPPYTKLKDRIDILKNKLDPLIFYAEVPEWPNGLEIKKRLAKLRSLYCRR